MSIWKAPITAKELTKRNEKTMSEFLGIEFTEVGDDYLTAKMPVNERTIQPYGIMHGGSSCVLAETVGSIAGNYCVDQKIHYCVGLDINTSHIRMAPLGEVVFGTARPVHIGKTTHVWEVRITNEKQQLISLTRLTLMVLNKEKP